MKQGDPIFQEVRQAIATTKKDDPSYKELTKIIAFDEALGKLHEAGIADEFLVAIKKSPEVLKAIDSVVFNKGPGPRADWSCCITSSAPVSPRPYDDYNVAKNPVDTKITLNSNIKSK